MDFGTLTPYLNVIAAMLPAALNVLDRFHIAKKLGEAVDEVRRQEAKQHAAEGYEPVLKNARYGFLKRRANRTVRQATKLRDLLKDDLKSVRALALKEYFDAFWQHERPRWASWFLKYGASEPCGANLRRCRNSRARCAITRTC